jgi:predicted ester cyclase
MSGEDRARCEVTLHRYIDEVLNERHDERIEEFFHPDFRHETDETALQFENTDVDLEGIQAGMAEMRDKLDPKYEAEVIRWEGDIVHLDWTFRGAHKGEVMGLAPTNKAFVVNYPGWTRFKDGKIISARSDWDPVSTLEAVKAQIYADQV